MKIVKLQHTSLAATVTSTSTTAVTAAAATVATATRSAAATTTVGGLVDADPTSIEPEKDQCLVASRDKGSRTPLQTCATVESAVTYSSLFKACIAESASASLAKRTKPKPLLRPVSRSFTTTCRGVSNIVSVSIVEATRSITDSFFDLAELLELLAQGAIVGMPGKPSVPGQWCRDVVEGQTYPMNSLDMLKADSNTERSQYKHSSSGQRAQYKNPRNKATTGIEETLRENGMVRRARNPSRRLMQVNGSNVRNEHLVLCAPGCFGVDGASEGSWMWSRERVAAG